MLERVKSFFRYYRSERRAVIALAIIFLIVLCSVEAYRTFYVPKPVSLEFILIEDSLSEKGNEYVSNDRPETIISPFNFDPNTLSDSGYFQMGFSEKEIKMLRNYQSAGGRFRKRDDFAKLYFIDHEEYELIKPYIQLPESSNENRLPRQRPINSDSNRSNLIKWSDTASYASFEYKPFICNLNTADTSELKRLKGIGSFYAQQIVSYRNELGGYHNLSQLLELWKMTPDKIDEFADQVLLRPEDLVKIDVNSVSAQELSKHPYVDFDLANRLILERETRNGFSDQNELCDSDLLAPDLCRKLVPYLTFGE